MTLVIGRRVHALRGRQMSQAELGERMTDLGCGRWSRTSVQKLETGKRGAVSVQELLALALIFGVQPVLLLVDPRTDQVVPVAKDVQLDAWTAFQWFTATRVLEGFTQPGAGEFGRQAHMVEHYVRLIGLLEYSMRTTPDLDTDAARDSLAKLFPPLIAELQKLRELGAKTLPELPDDVLAAARRVRFDIPDQVG